MQFNQFDFPTINERQPLFIHGIETDDDVLGTEDCLIVGCMAGQLWTMHAIHLLREMSVIREGRKCLVWQVLFVVKPVQGLKGVQLYKGIRKVLISLAVKTFIILQLDYKGTCICRKITTMERQVLFQTQKEWRKMMEF